MDFITGRQGANHVTSAQFRAIMESIVGIGSYIAPLNNQLAMELAANNTVNINSGVLFHHGGVFEVKKGTYDTVSYFNGTQGMKRIDLIVARYTMSPEGIENGEWAVIQGTPDASAPVTPAYTEGNMQAGDLIDECPVAEIHFDGLNVTEIKMLVEVSENIDSLKTMINTLTNDIVKSIGSIGEENDNYIIIGNYAVQWGEVVLVRSSNSVMTKTVDLPVKFANTDYSIQLTPSVSASAPYMGDISAAYASNADSAFSARAFSYHGLFTEENVKAYDVKVKWCAIGRRAV